MIELKLNSIPTAVFEVKPSEFGGSVERADIVAAGRLLMAERNGRDTNALRALEKKPAEYNPRLTDDLYAQTNENLKRKVCLYAAKMASAIQGASAPATYEYFVKNQRRYMSDSIFLKTMSGIVTDIVTPMLPTIMSNALAWMSHTVSVPIGQTYEIPIGSNDVFIFEDDSWGASRSKPANDLYVKPVTLNPTPRTAIVSKKWYQLVGNNADMGAFLNSIAAGMVNKVLALWNAQMIAASSNTKLVPTNLTFNSGASANWITAIKRVSMLAGTSFRNVIAMGDLSALTKALPDGVINAASTNLDAALATMLGTEWARYGYLGTYMGATLMPWDNAVVPGTQNTTITEMLPTDKIWFFPTVGYKPVYNAIEEGTPITVEMSPSDTADQTIDIVVTISIASVATFATKGALMQV